MPGGVSESHFSETFKPYSFLGSSIPMDEQRVVYKRNSVWWIATCYLFGTLFLLVYSVVSLLGFFADVGVSGVNALLEGSEDTKRMRSLASKIKGDVALLGYKVEKGNGSNTLTLSIQNNSAYSLSSLHVEVAALDAQGLPTYTRDEWLHNLKTVFPGDTAHAKVQLPAYPGNQYLEYTVRISDFSITGEQTFDEYCKSSPTIDNESS